jgi:acetoin utilization protein AcuB
VLDGGRLVGIVSDRDLKSSLASLTAVRAPEGCERLVEQLTAGDLMTRSVVTVESDLPVEEAAQLFGRHQLHAVPVVEDDRVVGIVTDIDVLNALAGATGVGGSATRLEVALGPSTRLSTIVAAAEQLGADVLSATMFTGQAGIRTAIVRVATPDPAPLIAALEAKGYWTKSRPRSQGA